MDRELVESLDVLIRFWERSAEPWSVKDNQSRYIYANSKFNKLFGLPDNFCVAGRFDSELPTPIAHFSAEYQRQDRQVELLQDRITSVEVHLLDGLSYFTAYFYDKYPLIDEHGVSQGVICHGRSVTNLILTRLSKIKLPVSLVLMQPLELFTKREWEVLFYLIHTFSSAEIAKKLGLSSRAVGHITQLIYKKVGISNKRQLIEYCYENKISNFVPKSFFEYSGPFPPNLKE